MLTALLLLGAALAVACGGERGDVVIEPVGGAARAGEAAGRGADGNDRRTTVFIDAGHGGSDPGWGSSYASTDAPEEKALTLDLAKRTAAYLEADGFRVVLSRTTDTDVNDPEADRNGDGCIEPIDEVQARMDLANAAGAAVLLSIHFNGLPNTPLSGAGAYYNAVREFAADNKRLAELVHAAQLETLAGFGHKARDWGALRDDSFDSPSQSKCPAGNYPYYTMIGPAAPGRPRPTQMPGVIVEPLFLTHPTEAALAARSDVRDALARGYARAIREFLSRDRSEEVGDPRGPALLVDRGDTSRKVLALTFDAGAAAGYTTAILDLLRRKRLTATFGLTGAWCEANPELARRITAEGHAVINHGYSHASWTGRTPRTQPLSAEQRREELQRAEEALQRTIGVSGRPYFRSPYSDEDAGVQRDLGALGYRYNVLWTFDSRAWKGAKANEIVSNGLKAAAPGGIYVFHVAEQQDVLALEPLIDGLIAAGYGFVTVPQLLTAQ